MGYVLALSSPAFLYHYSFALWANSLFERGWFELAIMLALLFILLIDWTIFLSLAKGCVAHKHNLLSRLKLILPPATPKTALKIYTLLDSVLVPLPPLLQLKSLATCKASLKKLQNRLIIVRLRLPPLLRTPLLPLCLHPPLPP